MSNQPPYGGLTGKTKTLGLDYSVAGLLAYLPICCIHVICSIIWLVSEPKENKVLRFHSMQSLLLLAVGIVCGVVFWILQITLMAGASATGSNAVGGAAVGGSFLILLVQLVFGAIILILHIVGMVKAYQGQIWKIPVIGNIADKNT
jgi:uncharacterized membrane protein